VGCQVCARPYGLHQYVLLTETRSILLAKLLLTDASLGRSEFISPSLLSNAKILELGSGTGTLSILLGQLVKEWTATDIAELLPLIAKNHKHNITRLARTNLNFRELDWTWSSQMFARNAQEMVHQQYDLLFAADCLYNEALLQPFVNTINRVNSKYVVIISELRSAEVLRLFIQLWLASGTWHIYRVGGYNHSDERLVKKESEEHPDEPLGHKHVMWVGWKAA
jgi:SAM-dependent methyltransferase